jgi:hypothetical protein
MTATVLAGFAGVLLALLLSYAPKFGTWFNAQPSETKVMINGGLLVVVAAGAYAVGCLGWAVQLQLVVTCDQAGLITMLGALLAALISNQSAYVAFVKPFPNTNPPQPLSVKGPQPK